MTVHPLLAASWRLVRRPELVVPVLLAIGVTAGSVSLMEVDYSALRLMRGVGVLLACAWVVAVDDPCGEVAAGSPYSRAVRSGTRALAAGAVVVPVWAACALTVQLVVPSVPVLGFGLEAIAMAGLGLALGMGLRAWRDLHTSSYLAGLGLIGFAVLTNVPPRWYALVQGQTWGPPWEASQIRWAALLLLALGVLGLALADPATRRGRVRADEACTM